MDVIVSHMNLDFDGLACLLAAKKLHPYATVALTDKQHPTVKSFLGIYRDQLAFSSYEKVDWHQVRTLILVDVASIERTGIPQTDLVETLHTIVYDHHSPKDGDLNSGELYVEKVGAAITLLTENLIKQNIPINPFEATLFGLGVYTDTGNFTYPKTTDRDLLIAAELRKRQMDVTLIDRFQEQVLSSDEKNLLQQLITTGEEQWIKGTSIFLSFLEQPTYLGGLATITRKLMESTSVDAAISIVKMRSTIYVVARANTERVDFRPLIEKLGGGGHAQAASATIKKQKLSQIVPIIQDALSDIIKKALTAADIMTSPVKSVLPEESIESVFKQMYQYGHTGFPVINEENQLVGVISRRDVDKATHHGLGHAPVKGYMSTQLIVHNKGDSLEEVQATMMKYNIGRIPILDNEQVVGIISRTDVIEQLHKQTSETEENLISTIQEQVPVTIFKLLRRIGDLADEQKVNVYLIGGIVRDFILKRPNEDIDIVVEGDGIAFAQLLSAQLGGNVKSHEKFGTATWTNLDGLKLDIVTCRTEYYDSPASLPIVRPSNLKEDLRRRDFTINAMALQLNKSYFGTIIDFFQGREDIKKQQIRILHTLSFIEDPTRIIRAVRFSLRFKYELSPQTWSLAVDANSMLRQVSATRFLHELELLIKEGTIVAGIQFLEQLGVWSSLFDVKVNNEIISTLYQTDTEDPFHYIVALLFPSKNWRKASLRYALSAKQQSLLKQLEAIAKIETNSDLSVGELHKLFSVFNKENVAFYALLSGNRSLQNYVNKLNHIKPLLTGSDLIALGLDPSPKFSELLHQLYCLQMDDQITTKDDALDWVKTLL
ncbi:CBS domain-containing protein [Halalkalibacter akibai]|uniref:tRNA nucleotidyltransferase n=1 Tax=Halalkalibacter akibai (strain ATCC 43226 / DSM 21942 / CIP 109018 / JCM 9157 / 1139) TaxID=1236973 RepID=W4QTP8_HALA3|nr:CBS domain-containing protein [Halalkalibacter akibai]GAE35436.1 tRNA nucleotidyltransferase [Halalkalibacter akibai JCM 9157]